MVKFHQMFKSSLKTGFAVAILASTALVKTAYAEVSFENKIVDAAEDGNVSLVYTLISSGEDVNSAGRFGATALHRSIYNGDVEIAEALIKAGANVNPRDAGGATPLHISARQGNTETAQFLIQNGADVNAKDNEGFTPLSRAVAGDFNDVVFTFLAFGADPNITNNSGESATSIAMQHQNQVILAAINRGNAAAKNSRVPSSGAVAKAPIPSDVIAAPVTQVAEEQMEFEDHTEPKNAFQSFEKKTLTNVMPFVNVPGMVVERALKTVLPIDESSRNEPDLSSNLRNASAKNIVLTAPQQKYTQSTQQPVAYAPAAVAPTQITELTSPTTIQNQIVVPTEQNTSNLPKSMQKAYSKNANSPASTANNFAPTSANINSNIAPTQPVLAPNLFKQTISTQPLVTQASPQPMPQIIAAPATLSENVTSQVAPVQNIVENQKPINLEDIQNNPVEATPKAEILPIANENVVIPTSAAVQPVEEQKIDEIKLNTLAPLAPQVKKQPAPLVQAQPAIQTQPVNPPISESQIAEQKELERKATEQKQLEEKLAQQQVSQKQIAEQQAKLQQQLEEKEQALKQLEQAQAQKIAEQKIVTQPVNPPVFESKTTKSKTVEAQDPVAFAAPAPEVVSPKIPKSLQYKTNLKVTPELISQPQKAITPENSPLTNQVANQVINSQETVVENAADEEWQNTEENISKTEVAPEPKAEVNAIKSIENRVETLINEPVEFKKVEGVYDTSSGLGYAGTLNKINARRSQNLSNEINSFYGNTKTVDVKNVEEAPASLGAKVNTSQNDDSDWGGLSAEEINKLDAEITGGSASSKSSKKIITEAEIADAFPEETEVKKVEDQPIKESKKEAEKTVESNTLAQLETDQSDSKKIEQELNKPFESENKSESTPQPVVSTPEPVTEAPKDTKIRPDEVQKHIGTASVVATNQNKTAAVAEVAQEELAAPVMPTEITAPTTPQPAVAKPVTPQAPEAPKMPELKSEAAAPQVPALGSKTEENKTPENKISDNEFANKLKAIDEPADAKVISSQEVEALPDKNKKSVFDDVKKMAEEAEAKAFNSANTFAVIGSFSNADDVVNHYNNIASKTGVVYPYKVSKTNSDNKFYLQIGPVSGVNVTDEICATFAVEAKTCRVPSISEEDTKFLDSLKTQINKQVYSLVGEFKTEAEAKTFYESKFVNYNHNIIKTAKSGVYGIQIGPLENGGIAKTVCDKFKTEKTNCNVSVK